MRKLIKEYSIQGVIEKRYFTIWARNRHLNKTNDTIKKIIQICLFHSENSESLLLDRKTRDVVKQILELFQTELIVHVARESQPLNVQRFRFLENVLSFPFAQKLKTQSFAMLQKSEESKHHLDKAVVKAIYFMGVFSDKPEFNSEYQRYFAHDHLSTSKTCKTKANKGQRLLRAFYKPKQILKILLSTVFLLIYLFLQASLIYKPTMMKNSMSSLVKDSPIVTFIIILLSSVNVVRLLWFGEHNLGFQEKGEFYVKDTDSKTIMNWSRLVIQALYPTILNSMYVIYIGQPELYNTAFYSVEMV